MNSFIATNEKAKRPEFAYHRLQRYHTCLNLIQYPFHTGVQN